MVLGECRQSGTKPPIKAMLASSAFGPHRTFMDGAANRSSEPKFTDAALWTNDGYTRFSLKNDWYSQYCPVLSMANNFRTFIQPITYRSPLVFGAGNKKCPIVNCFTNCFIFSDNLANVIRIWVRSYRRQPRSARLSVLRTRWGSAKIHIWCTLSDVGLSCGILGLIDCCPRVFHWKVKHFS